MDNAHIPTDPQESKSVIIVAQTKKPGYQTKFQKRNSIQGTNQEYPNFAHPIPKSLTSTGFETLTPALPRLFWQKGLGDTLRIVEGDGVNKSTNESAMHLMQIKK
jgi:hypothetical protein